MSRGAKIWIVLAILAILAGLILFGGAMAMAKWDFSKLSTTQYETTEYTVTDPYTGVWIYAKTAAVTFAPSEDGVTKVVCHEEKKMPHEVSVKEGVLTVEVKDERKWYEYIGISFDSPKVTVYLPAGAYEAFTVHTNTGSVEIPGDFRAERIDISTSTGDVKCGASTTGELAVTVSTGEIRLENLFAQSISLKASTGRVSASGVTCAGEFFVRVSTGKTVLENISCGRLSTTGNTGDVVLQGVIAGELFSIERSTGDVTFDRCDAPDITVTTDTGSVKGTLLTGKEFIVKTDTGRREVPPSTSGGVCRITTDTGNVRIQVEEKTTLGEWVYPTLISDYCTIPEELVLEMRRNYPKQYLPNLEVDYSNVLMTCYGSFGGVYVVRIGSGIVSVGDSNKHFDTIGGVKIPSEMLLLLHAYHEGVFYRLDEAYNNGYLTSGELEILKERYED